MGSATGTAALIMDITFVPMAVTAVVKEVMIPSIAFILPSKLEYRHYDRPSDAEDPKKHHKAEPSAHQWHA